LALLHHLLASLHHALADLRELLPLLAVVVVMMVVMMMVVVCSEHRLKIGARLRTLQAERVHGTDLQAALKVYRGQTHQSLLRSFLLTAQQFAKPATALTLNSIFDRLMSTTMEII